ncbi:MAG: hypothetical protein NW217_00335 [Hyphomicrobiaceae bacterium]|nr:hypothetical protein [Hyphomicrobiaceae bacterium]
MSIAADVDDSALEAMARTKGVPAMVDARALPREHREEQGRGPLAEPEGAVRPRLSYIKAAIPDYALTELKTRALKDDVTVNHLILKALSRMGIAILPEHMVEDGRRLRGRNALSRVGLSSA